MNESILTIKNAFEAISNQNIKQAQNIIEKEYPFMPIEKSTRNYTTLQKIKQFKRDGFIDRYSGKKLVNPGVLKVISHYLPETFPYQKNWKMTECHIGYWELVPTLDHIYPIALGGSDNPDNWATTSMLNNSIKSNWTLEQMRWTLVEAGNFEEWDGMTKQFVEFVDNYSTLLKDNYILNWYKASIKIL